MLKSFSNCHNCFDGCLKETERIIDSEVEQMPVEEELYLYEIHRKVVYFEEEKNEIQEKNTIESEQHREEGREKKI